MAQGGKLTTRTEEYAAMGRQPLAEGQEPLSRGELVQASDSKEVETR